MMEASKAIKQYALLIEKFNKRINLISRKDIQNLWARHIDDAILSHQEYLNNYRLPDGYSIYDLGSGNGIPGFVWAILSPKNDFYLVDTDERKCEFLKYAASSLKITNIEVLCQDFNTIKPSEDSAFLCRGLMSIEEFIVKDNVFYNKQGFFVKGSTWNTEIGSIALSHFDSKDYSLADQTTRSLVKYSP